MKEQYRVPFAKQFKFSPSQMTEAMEIDSAMARSYEHPHLTLMAQYKIAFPLVFSVYNAHLSNAILAALDCSTSPIEKSSYPRDIGFHIYLPDDEINLFIYNPEKHN
jgi:hypothetical protein